MVHTFVTRILERAGGTGAEGDGVAGTAERAA
jgi:hypothetical protein